jgi:hypothetical protein
MSIEKQKLQSILQKAQGLEKNQALALAKSFIDLEDKIDNIKIPEPTDLTALVNMLNVLENKLEEETEIELIIE